MTKAFPGLEITFPGPYFRYLDERSPDVEQLGRVAEQVSTVARSPEDFMRLMGETELTHMDPTDACNFIDHVMESELDVPYDGVIGFCEGACVGAAAILRHAETHQSIAFKCAIFFCGFPVFKSEDVPMGPEDKSTQVITIPTGHIVGSSDPCRPASVALYNMCKEDCALLYEHKKGHTIPWDKEDVGAMAKVVRQTVSQAIKSC